MQDITRLLKILSTSREKFLAAIHSVPNDRWQQRPTPDAWSAAEVSVHVTMVERSVHKNVNRVLSAPPANLPFTRRFHLPIRIASLRYPRVKSPIPLKPEFLGDKAKITESLAFARKLTIDFLEENRSRDLSAYRFPHPFIGSLNIYDWHELIAYHEDRHRKQIREIVEKFQL